MLKPTIDTPSGYIEKLRPIYVELFRMAHVIVGNLELAEYVLRKAVYEAYRRRGEWRERMSFAEGLQQTVRMVGLAELQSIRAVGSFESDWAPPELPPDADPDQRALLSRVQRESPELVRELMLYYGCGLKVSQIAQIMAEKPTDVKDALFRFRRRLERSRAHFQKGAKHAMEDQLERLLLALLGMPGEDVPDSGVVFRAFERDADAAPRARRPVSHLIAGLLVVAGALVCALMFWLVAVLIEPVNPLSIPANAPAQTAQIEAES